MDWLPIDGVPDNVLVIMGSPTAVGFGVAYRRRSDNAIITMNKLPDGSWPTKYMLLPPLPKE